MVLPSIIHEARRHDDQIIRLDDQVFFQVPFLPDILDIDLESFFTVACLADQPHFLLVRKIAESPRDQNRLADREGLPGGNVEAAFVAYLASDINLASD